MFYSLRRYLNTLKHKHGTNERNVDVIFTYQRLNMPKPHTLYVLYFYRKRNLKETRVPLLLKEQPRFQSKQTQPNDSFDATRV